jgi:hypothetical protein
MKHRSVVVHAPYGGLICMCRIRFKGFVSSAVVAEPLRRYERAKLPETMYRSK